MKHNPELLERGRQYAEFWGGRIDLNSLLGCGTDGDVWATERRSALKVFLRERNFKHELECYQRFQKSKTVRIFDFQIPKLFGYSNNLMIIEIGIVEPPFILDFGKVSLDAPADFEERTMEEEMADHAEQFGPERWQVVLEALWLLQSKFGIYYLDPKPSNITFAGDPSRAVRP